MSGWEHIFAKSTPKIVLATSQVSSVFFSSSCLLRSLSFHSLNKRTANILMWLYFSWYLALFCSLDSSEKSNSFTFWFWPAWWHQSSCWGIGPLSCSKNHSFKKPAYLLKASSIYSLHYSKIIILSAIKCSSKGLRDNYKKETTKSKFLNLCGHKLSISVSFW